MQVTRSYQGVGDAHGAASRLDTPYVTSRHELKDATSQKRRSVLYRDVKLRPSVAMKRPHKPATERNTDVRGGKRCDQNTFHVQCGIFTSMFFSDRGRFSNRTTQSPLRQSTAHSGWHPNSSTTAHNTRTLPLGSCWDFCSELCGERPLEFCRGCRSALCGAELREKLRRHFVLKLPLGNTRRLGSHTKAGCVRFACSTQHREPFESNTQRVIRPTHATVLSANRTRPHRYNTTRRQHSKKTTAVSSESYQAVCATLTETSGTETVSIIVKI